MKPSRHLSFVDVDCVYQTKRLQQFSMSSTSILSTSLTSIPSTLMSTGSRYTNIHWHPSINVNRLNGPASIDIRQLTSINPFSDVDYLLVYDGKILRKINNNPYCIILDNPGIIQVGKCRVFRRLSPIEYSWKISRKMRSNPQHIPIGNMSGLALLIRQVFQGIFR